ncbi:hypothetical protein D7004_15615 [Pedobacter jejuensis]|uniref:Uncharacterized protein n=1 Tax=Pedobacter jejuensis TaxID=1268550 RepID=A0A3N0BQ20_9SPHI|nr:hypothetical protein D7004_15615 [Pedobacter jejuensis]
MKDRNKVFLVDVTDNTVFEQLKVATTGIAFLLIQFIYKLRGVNKDCMYSLPKFQIGIHKYEIINLFSSAACQNLK